jgi:hypothetical protein
MRSKAQGSTEYLLFLAFVLIVALVVISLLNFFPVTSLEAKLTQSKMYWSSASPIAIVEWGVRNDVQWTTSWPYFRIRNTGVYPIRIIALIAADGGRVTNFWTNLVNPEICPGSTGPGWYPNISDYYYLAPGEEKYFGWIRSQLGGIPCEYSIGITNGNTTGPSPPTITTIAGGATSICQNSTINRGILETKFGFEYIEYIEGKEITKRQIGSVPIVIKCIDRSG